MRILRKVIIVHQLAKPYLCSKATVASSLWMFFISAYKKTNIQRLNQVLLSTNARECRETNLYSPNSRHHHVSLPPSTPPCLQLHKRART